MQAPSFQHWWLQPFWRSAPFFSFFLFLFVVVVVVVFLLLLPLLVHFMFPIAFIWKVLPQFGFVTMMLHFDIAFAIAMI